MALASLAVRGFRNLVEQELGFAPGGNFAFGPNGAGKTNVLEAIHCLGTGRSFRAGSDDDMVAFGSDVAVLSGVDDAGACAEVRITSGEKRLWLGRVQVDRLSGFFGWLPVVTLLLDDVELVRGGPAVRRKYLDTAIAKSDRTYIALLASYRRALAQRNRLLERGQSGEHLLSWDDELVKTGVALYERREAALASLLGSAAGFGRRIADAAPEFQYAPSIGPRPDRAAEFRRLLAATHERSLIQRRTLVGPHRDDIRVRFDSREIRRYGSVGEQRLAGIALRLAEAEMIAATGRRPTFLLDEVASELDDRRSRLVFELVAERGQVIYAAARRFELPGPGAGAKEFRISAGKVSEV